MATDMKPEDVPAEWIDVAADAMDTWGTGHLRRDLPHALAAVIPLIREQVAKEMADTCQSCAHLTSFHQEDGCWFTVTSGRPGRDLVCPCAVPAPAARGEA